MSLIFAFATYKNQIVITLFLIDINTLFPSLHVSCFSSVGNRRVGKQSLSIGTNCDRIATIEHEFLHALGFWHEQSRSDRDDYVKIMWDRITEGTEPLAALILLKKSHRVTHGVVYNPCKGNNGT